LAAGAVVVCARTGLANRNRDAKAAAATREDIVIMEAPRVEEAATLRCDAEPRMNEAARGVLGVMIFYRNE
jgi:hypothetical protein